MEKEQQKLTEFYELVNKQLENNPDGKIHLTTIRKFLKGILGDSDTPKFKVGELAMNYGKECRILEYNEGKKFPYLIHILSNNNKVNVSESDLEIYEEEINLVELLKGHEEEKFYSPMFGEVKFIGIVENVCEKLYLVKIKYFEYGSYDCEYTIESNGCGSKGGRCILYPTEELYLKYPLNPYLAWMEWDKENNKKTPKTWSEYLNHPNCEITSTISLSLDGKDYLANNTPIEKSALALLKIHQLIEVGYGGNVTDEEWRNDKVKKWYFVPNKQYSPDKGNDMWEIVYSMDYYKKRNIAFHTNEQAEEFLSRPENIQLLKDYHII